MGADVIKVERPDVGDETRRAPPFVNGLASQFLILNRNKRSLALDLKRPQGREVFLRLVRGADVVAENMRPGTMAELGLAYEDLRPLNPALVYCSISGFGQTGPYRDRGGFDLVAQAMSGILSVTGPPGGPPVKVGVPICDIMAGTLAAHGILSAYIHRLRSGQGQYVDTSLLEAGIFCTFWETTLYFATGKVPRPEGTAHRNTAPYQVLRCQDGSIALGAANPANWERLCRLLGREDLLQDPRFKERPARLQNQQQLAAILEEHFTQRPTAYWVKALAEAGVPAGPVYTIPQVYQHPQVRAREMLVEVDNPHGGKVKNIGIPIKLSLTPGRIRLPPPLLGQHTDEVLQEAGFTPQEVSRLRAEGVVR